MAKLGEGLKFKYEPIWPQAPTDMRFHYYEELEDGTQVLRIHEENFKLVSSIEELKSYVEVFKDKTIGFDTETTGLTYGEDKIVGFSLSADRWSGIYVPIRHRERLEVTTEVPKLDKNGNKKVNKAGKVAVKKEITVTFQESDANLDPKQALDVLYEILINAKLVLAHNSEFDLNVLKFEGYNVNKIKSFDTLILPYVYDPEATGLAGLKALEKRVLGRTVPEFKEVLGKKYENFGMVPPKDGYVYACYDKETEVLTENGWVYWRDYNGIDKLATVRLSDGLYEYQSPTKIYKYRYKGKMECCKSQSIDYCVTPNHSMAVAVAQNPNKGWTLKRADELNVEEVALTAPTQLNSFNNFININGNKYNAKNMAELAAIILADGYVRVREDNSHEVCLVTSSEKNYTEVVSILEQSPFKWHPYSNKKNSKITQWSCYNKDLWDWLVPFASHGAALKRVPPDIFSLSQDAIQAFLHAYSLTDGHQYPSGATRYYSVSIQMINDIQQLLLMTGKRSSVYQRAPKDVIIEGRQIKKENCRTIYTVNTTAAVTTRYKKQNRFQVEYNDYVYCAEVPNHTLITRRNGSTLVAGNCCDTSGVVGIYEEMYPKVRQLLKKFKNPLIINGVPYDVISRDNVMVKIFVDYYGHAKIPIDRERAIKYKKQLEERQKAVIKEIYEYFDKGMFNLSPSSNEFKAVMASKQVFTGVKTEKDGDSWSKKAQDEMKRNLMKLKECITNWKSYNFTNGKLSKDGAGFTLATILELYGKPYFKMKTTINNITFKGLKGEPMDLKMFWLTVKNMYLNEKKKLYILNRIQENNSLCKALNSYVDKLTQVDECVMHYRLKGTKSGRLSSGNGSKSEKSRNHYYIDLNAQNLTKPASAYYVAEECPMTNEESILGWKFTPVAKDYAMEHLEDLYIVEGQDPNITVRSCLKAPKGRYVVSLDYDAQEYRLIAILSQDSKMLENFFNGIDPHTASAYAIWGEENYDKGKRKKAKIFNFLNNYSGGAYTLAQQLDIAPTEAQEMIDKYNRTFHEMVAWKEQQIGLMYQNEGVVFNAFGRPRQFKGWIDLINKNSENYDTLIEKQNLEAASNRVKSAIERRVPSHLIQGTAGDILRLVMINLYIKYFRHRDPHIDFLSTVHDEVNYTIDKEVTTQYVKDLEELMTFDLLDPRLPIATSTDIGFTYGNMFPFVWKDESKTILIPKRVHHA